MTLSYSDVAEIVKIVDSSNCEEVSLELEGARILIRRKGAEGAASAPTPTMAAAVAPAQAVATPAPAQAAPAAPPAPAPQPTAAAEGEHVVAPMVGTFYSRPSPEEPAFVSVGARVEVGTPLCIIEVMKLFTTVEASRAGTIKAVLAQEGQMVEYGQPLFVIG